MRDHAPSSPPKAIDLVWDGHLRGTALSHSGRRLRVGTGGDWPPDALFALAYGTSVMETFLALADHARLEVLAYVSAVSVEPRPDGRHAVVLSPCVMVGTAHGVETAERLLAAAVKEAPIAPWTAARVELRAHVHPPSPRGPHPVSTPQADAVPSPTSVLPSARHVRES